jgi:Fe2+ transport system protein FeoA
MRETSTIDPRENNPPTLLELREGEAALVTGITGGKAARARMSGFGIYEGKRIRLIKAAPFNGPLLVEDTASGARTMIGRAMAGSVEVIPEEPS